MASSHTESFGGCQKQLTLQSLPVLKSVCAWFCPAKRSAVDMKVAPFGCALLTNSARLHQDAPLYAVHFGQQSRKISLDRAQLCCCEYCPGTMHKQVLLLDLDTNAIRVAPFPLDCICSREPRNGFNRWHDSQADVKLERPLRTCHACHSIVVREPELPVHCQRS